MPEYWIIDPGIQAIKVYRVVDGQYRKAAELSLDEEAVLTTPLLPGLRLPLARIFELP